MNDFVTDWTSCERQLADTLRKRVKTPEDAEDVLTAVKLRAFKHYDKFEGRCAPLTYFTRIAFHELYAYYSEKQQNIEFIDITEIERECIKTPQNELEAKQTAIRMNECFQKLPKDLQFTLYSKEINDFTFKEIALSLKCTIGSVRNKLFRAKSKMTELMQEYDTQFTI